MGVQTASFVSLACFATRMLCHTYIYIHMCYFVALLLDVVLLLNVVGFGLLRFVCCRIRSLCAYVKASIVVFELFMIALRWALHIMVVSRTGAT